MTVVAFPAPALTWEQEEILRLRDEVHDLRQKLAEALRAARSTDAPATPRFPAAWKLPRNRALLLAKLYQTKGPVALWAIRDHIAQLASPDTGTNLASIQISRLRKAMRPLGVEIINHRGIGFELTVEGRAIIKAAIEECHEPPAPDRTDGDAAGPDARHEIRPAP